MVAWIMTGVIYEYQIPNPAKPIPESERALGPSGELINFSPEQVIPAVIIGQTVLEICPYLGTYGMGGPGFFGLRVEIGWLVIAIWGASEWMTAKGRNIGDSFHDNYGRGKPWLADWQPEEERDELSKNLLGQKITNFEVAQKSLCILFENGFDITIQEHGKTRPILEGNKLPRNFQEEDDLRKAVFLSPTTEIWV